VMIGGLISSTLLSRIVTPVVYKLIPPRIWLWARFYSFRNWL
jgi:Cu/Ag efflux pump CusA